MEYILKHAAKEVCVGGKICVGTRSEVVVDGEVCLVGCIGWLRLQSPFQNEVHVT